MLSRWLDRLSPRGEGIYHAVTQTAAHGVLLVVCAVLATLSARTLLEERALSRMTARAPCGVLEVRTDAEPGDRFGFEVACRYQVGGQAYRGWFRLPDVGTSDRALANDLVARYLAGDEPARSTEQGLQLLHRTDPDTIGVVLVHYDPANPTSAAIDSSPRYVVPLVGLGLSLLFGLVLLRSARGGYRALRRLTLLRLALARTEARQAKRARAKEAEPERGRERETGADAEGDDEPTGPRRQILALHARNHLPAQPPAGWSLPAASGTDRTAWVIDTPRARLLVRLVRQRGRAMLQVTIDPAGGKLLTLAEHKALLEPFRAVGQFEESAEPSGGSPGRRVFHAPARVASVETWGAVEQSPDRLN